MAKLTERQFKTGDKMGQREELADLISLVDAKDTPFTSMAKKGSKPQNTYFRWQVDRLPSPRVQTVIDGTDVDPNGAEIENYVRDTVGGETVQYRKELAAYVQIFRRSVRVSPLTEDINNVAGVNSELANNVAKAIKLIKRDQEVTFTGTQGCSPDRGTGSGQGYQTRGLHKWLLKRTATVETVTNGVPTPDATKHDGLETIPSEFRTPDSSHATGSVSALSEAQIQNVLTSMYKETGTFRDMDALVGPNLKRAFTNLVFNTPSSGSPNTQVAIRTLNRESKESSYISSVDVFVGDFGKLRLHPSHWLKWNDSTKQANDNVGYVIPFDMVEIRYGGNVAGVRPLTNNGGGEARLVEAVAGLVVHNPLSFGVFDLTA
jgi:hypothetical protein